jgi:lipoprotein-anchoring transpeptidase ErfK/SrfK
MEHRDNHRGRPRYGRIAALASSVTVTVLAALAGTGMFAETSAAPTAGARDAAYNTSSTTTSGTSTIPDTSPDTSTDTSSSGQSSGHDTSSSGSVKHSPGLQTTSPHGLTALPDSSGEGKRIVFSQHLQRVWLVSATNDVRRTYLVSGSKTHNLQPGTYSVYSRSLHAIGVDDSGTMEYFVRFTQGPTGAAIGFHSIPTKDGHLIQTAAQLGTTQSHGCIRQWLPDAIALWKFAPDGTSVVVVA